MVYKARDPIIDRWVAIKIIRFDQFYEENEIQELKERFFTEAQAAGKLIHPNIVTIFDVGEDGGSGRIELAHILPGADGDQHAEPFRKVAARDIYQLNFDFEGEIRPTGFLS
jgi:serine/threonine-protein kinase